LEEQLEGLSAPHPIMVAKQLLRKSLASTYLEQQEKQDFRDVPAMIVRHTLPPIL
jgi:hypothetical protein